jgi:hypothetical protein
VGSLRFHGTRYRRVIAAVLEPAILPAPVQKVGDGPPIITHHGMVLIVAAVSDRASPENPR